MSKKLKKEFVDYEEGSCFFGGGLLEGCENDDFDFEENLKKYPEILERIKKRQDKEKKSKKLKRI